VEHHATGDFDGDNREDIAAADFYSCHGNAVQILVNSAGRTKRMPTLDFPEPDWRSILDTNLTGTLRACQAFGRHMIERGYGRIINIASIAGLRPQFEGLMYSMTKAALIMMTQSYALELGPKGVRVNAIAPGIIRSTGTDRYPEELVAMARRETPWKRLGVPEEVAHLAVYLASDAADFVTGATYYIDGGAALWGDIFPLPDE